MAKRMLVHDRRLIGNAPSIAQNTYVVGQKVAIGHIVAWVGGVCQVPARARRADYHVPWPRAREDYMKIRRHR